MNHPYTERKPSERFKVTGTEVEDRHTGLTYCMPKDTELLMAELDDHWQSALEQQPFEES